MKKIIFRIIVFMCLFIINISVFALDIYSNNGIMFNMNDDSVIFEKKSNEKVKVASLTKIMTSIVALESINNLDEKVIMPISAYSDLSGYVTSGIKPGDRVTYRDLLYGIMLPSAGDCANAIAILTYGSVSSFVDKMNEKVSELNLVNTHFSNPIGKDEDNYSTVYDIAIILKYALDNDEFYKLFTARNYITTNNIKFESTLIKKSNGLNVSNILGSKTGFTDIAGNCLASISKINNVKYLFVTVGADTKGPYQFMDAVNTYDYFSKNYGYKRILNYNQQLGVLKVKNLFVHDYFIKSNSDIYLYLNNDIDINDLDYVYEGIDTIDNKINKGDYLGKVNIMYNDNILFAYNIYLDSDITNYNYLIILFPLFIFLIVLCVMGKRHKV